MNKVYKIIKTETDYLEALNHINSHDFLSYDVETTGLNVRKDQVVGFSFSGESGRGYYVPIKIYCPLQNMLNDFLPSWDYKKLLIALSSKGLLMFNGSFDIRVTRNNLGFDFLENLEADVMLMKHTLEEEGTFKLKEIASIYQSEIGLDMQELANQEQVEMKESVIKNGGSVTKSNFEIYKADLECLGKYACMDADLTIRLALFFNRKLQEENLLDFFYKDEVMPLYKEVTIPMEDKGIKIDLDLINTTKEEITKVILEKENKIIEELLKLPETQIWLEDKINKEIKVSNKGTFAQKVVELNLLDLKKSKSGRYSLTKSAIEKLEDSPVKKFLEGDLEAIDTKKISKILYKEKNPKIINIASKKQLGEIVFDYMGIKPLSYTKKNSPQFNDTMIEYLADSGYNWAKLLRDYNKLCKINGTYIDRPLNNHEEGIYYPYFKQHGTISGRYSSDLQQLPRPKETGELSSDVLYFTNKIREFYIARDGRVFIDSDYESLEPHVFSSVSSDQRIMDIFRKGHDFYSTIAIATENLKDVSADKKADNYLGKVNKPKRSSSKIYSLGIPYGLKAFKLSKLLNVSVEEAEKLINNYLNSFPDLKKWMEDTGSFVRKSGYITTKSGRKRHLNKVKTLYDIHKDNLLNYKYRSTLSRRYGKEEVLSIYRDFTNGINNAYNFQIQGLAASIVNRAMINISREFKKRGIDGWICATIHDQIIADVPESRAEECKNLVEEIMCNSFKLDVELKAPAQIARNFKEGH